MVPSVTAGWGPADASLIFNTPAKRQAHVAAIVKLVTDNGFDGIDIDYEKMAYTTNPVVGQRLRTGFTAFATELCGKLRAMHKRCTITVMAKTADGHTTYGIDKWVFDYAALGRVASRVRLMVVRPARPWGSPGPIADISWTEDVVRYATSVIAPSKVELAYRCTATTGRRTARRRCSGIRRARCDRAQRAAAVRRGVAVADLHATAPAASSTRSGSRTRGRWRRRSPSRTATTWVPSGSGTSGTSHRRRGRCCAASTADPEVRIQRRTLRGSARCTSTTASS